jgi:hypothetical protein
MKRRTVSWLLAIALCAVAARVHAEDKAKTANSQGFEAIKKLAGDWVEVGKDGKPTDKVVRTFRVTAGGSVVQETMMPGTDHEMVTMYHLDGPDLILTHYCTLGNQPRMRAEPGKDPNQLVFKFVSAGNLKSDGAMHMREANFTFIDNDHFKNEWTACENGKPCHKANFDLVRKAK